MKNLNKPNLPFDNIFSDCVSNMRMPRRRHLQNAKSMLDARNGDYDLKASTGELYTISSHTNVTANVSTEDMVYLYERKLLKEGRTHYDELMTSAPHDTCPYCSQRKVKSLDHYLPKTRYPSFSITPMNLVPCCSDCNKDKGAPDPGLEEEQIIHPYYDDIGGVIWLNAEIIEREPVAVVFNVAEFSSADEILHARITQQFELLGLGKLYSSHAAEELENINGVLTALKRVPDRNALVDYLQLQYDSCFDRHPNSWNTAMYRALLSSEWFQQRE